MNFFSHLKQRQLNELQQKQVELQAQSQSTWSSLFRGGKQNPPSLLDIQNEQAQIELAKQQEQFVNSTKQKQTTMSSLLTKPQPPQPATWAAWGSNSANAGVSSNENVNSNFPLPSAPTTTTMTAAPAAHVSAAINAAPFWHTPQETKKPPNKKFVEAFGISKISNFLLKILVLKILHKYQHRL